jgi:molybdenum cofactor cytidylyltransferase
MSDIHVIILAAGASTRFGRPKQLATIGGAPMLQQVVAQAQAFAGPAVTVVIGANAAEIAPALARSSAGVVVNRHWAEGMASSIRAGIKQVPSHSDAALLLLADQPAITSGDLTRLADAWRREPQRIAAALYGDGRGVPAVFPRSAFPALLALRGERGAQALLRSPGSCTAVAMPSAALDVDTPEDLPDFAPPSP